MHTGRHQGGRNVGRHAAEVRVAVADGQRVHDVAIGGETSGPTGHGSLASLESLDDRAAGFADLHDVLLCVGVWVGRAMSTRLASWSGNRRGRDGQRRVSQTRSPVSGLVGALIDANLKQRGAGLTWRVECSALRLRRPACVLSTLSPGSRSSSAVSAPSPRLSQRVTPVTRETWQAHRPQEIIFDMAKY
jgi:hypothetical protein